MPDTFIMLVT